MKEKQIITSFSTSTRTRNMYIYKKSESQKVGIVISHAYQTSKLKQMIGKLHLYLWAFSLWVFRWFHRCERKSHIQFFFHRIYQQAKFLNEIHGSCQTNTCCYVKTISKQAPKFDVVVYLIPSNNFFFLFQTFFFCVFCSLFRLRQEWEWKNTNMDRVSWYRKKENKIFFFFFWIIIIGQYEENSIDVIDFRGG